MGRYRKGPGIFPAIAIFFVALGVAVAGGNQFAACGKGPAVRRRYEWAQHVVQSYQQIQEQQRSNARWHRAGPADAAAAARAIEQARQDAETSARRNSEEVEARLTRIEQSVTAQREHEIETVRLSQRSTLITVGILRALDSWERSSSWCSCCGS